MPQIVVDDGYLKLDVGGPNEIDVSPDMTGFELNTSTDIEDATCMGKTTKVKEPSLKDWSIEAHLKLNTANGGQDEKLFALWGTKFDIECCFDGSTPSATNPVYSGEAILENAPRAATIGNLATVNISLQGSDDLDRAEA